MANAPEMGETSRSVPDRDKAYRVTASVLNMREGPGPKHPVIGKLDNGAVVSVLERSKDGDWALIAAHDGKNTLNGWVDGRYLTVEKVEEVDRTMEVRAKKRVRSKAADAAGLSEAAALDGARATRGEGGQGSATEDVASKRIAIVIGSTRHRGHPVLRTASAGAMAFREALAGALLNIETVISRIDEADGFSMDRFRREVLFPNSAPLKDGQGVHVILFYSGYGIENQSGRFVARLLTDEPLGVAPHVLVSQVSLFASVLSVTCILDLVSTQSVSYDIKDDVYLSPREVPWSIIAGVSAPPDERNSEANGPSAFVKAVIKGLNWTERNPGPLTASGLLHMVGNEAAVVGSFELFEDHRGDIDLSDPREFPHMGTEGVQEKTLRETTRTHHDDAAKVDHLGRKAFAQLLAQRIRQARGLIQGTDDIEGAGDSYAFMVHLHGPWGSGKSSVLNFLKDELTHWGWKADRRRRRVVLHDLSRWQRWKWRVHGAVRYMFSRASAIDRLRAMRRRAWVVVDFNAWRHQRVKPPWWSLIHVIASQGRKQLTWAERQRFGVTWFLRRFRADLLAWGLAIVFLALSIALFLSTANGGAQDTSVAMGSVTEGKFKGYKDWWAAISGVLTILLGFVAWSRTFFLDARSAQHLADMRSDVMRPVVKLFDRIIHFMRRPVIIYIDDLDRCDQPYVVELLEGVQTLFRDTPVTFLVAADKQWICTSFEQHYTTFGPVIGVPGRPLGHLFLEKMFQISAELPRVPGAARDRFLRQLLDSSERPDERTPLNTQTARSEVLEEIAKLPSNEELRELGKRTDDPAKRQVIAEKIVERSTESDQAKALEHRLMRFADLLEHNPRAMKRLVNAFAMNLAVRDLQQNFSDLDDLARWTILELRWPTLAEHITKEPEATNLLHGATGIKLPERMAPLLEDDEVKRVAGAIREEDDPPGGLTVESVRKLLG